MAMMHASDRLTRPGALLHGCGGEEAAPTERETRRKHYDAAREAKE